MKTIYYSSFIGLVIVPVIIVLILSLTILNRVFRQQALENVERAQEAVVAELVSDMEQISMRLSHMAYANNGELLALAADTDTPDYNKRYQSERKLYEAASYATEPVKDIVSVAFYMKDGRETFFKNDILIPSEEIRQERWYQQALEQKNRVVMGSYDTNDVDLYNGGTADSFVLVAAMAPDVVLDRSEKIEMVCFFQVSGASDKIKTYNTGYRQKKNKIGYTRIVDGAGGVVYQSRSLSEPGVRESSYIRVETPLEVFGNDWKLESYVKRKELTADYHVVAAMLLLAMAVVLALYTTFSQYFLRQIIQPVQQMSHGLKQVEEGMLDVHLSPAGQGEVRAMLHSFNAMVRRLRALIADYEEKMKHSAKLPSDYMGALVRGEMTPEEVKKLSADFFADQYLLFAVFPGTYREKGEGRKQCARKLAAEFDTIPRFASRCVMEAVDPERFVVYYRITEPYFEENLYAMLKELLRVGKAVADLSLSVCIGKVQADYRQFTLQVEEVLNCYDLCILAGEGAVLDLNRDYGQYRAIADLAPEYGKLAAALYIADEKTISEEKERMLQKLQAETLDQGRNRTLAAVLATARQFLQSDADFNGIFGQSVDYYEKLRRIDDIRSLRLWVTNYLSWVADYSNSQLDVVQTDAVTRAKHYIMEHYQNPDLALKEVAEYVDLSEKYFTTKFTKECGETFLSYLTGLRVQKAKELIKTTTFKMYEIGEMVGYNNPEHFNRIFKKSTGMSPAQYRKAP
ncbi:helix-turn-helix domain-containing protein [Clostridium sp. AN503]|uniref:helix-turn-helix domain-containing protein n=1 Tax=Clostridium sp. AN503 TaxID=3160598 RepID=UPI003457963D